MRDAHYREEQGFDSREAYEYDTQYEYGAAGQYEGQATGFTRHQSTTSRRSEGRTPNPVVGVVKQASGAVSNALGGIRQRRQSRNQQRQPRRAPSDAYTKGDDYLGVGNACRVCGNPVDENQARCPHCGAFVRPLYQQVLFWVSIIVLIAIIVVLSVVINSCRSSHDDTTGPAVVAGVDTTALTTAVSDAQAVLDAQQSIRTYTRHSLGILQNAVSEANALLANGSMTAEQVASATQSVRDAASGLAPMLDEDSYPWPAYEEFADDGRLGHQVAINGVCQSVTTDEDGSFSATIAMSEDGTNLVYVSYVSSDVTGDLEVGSSCTVYGVVAGSSDGVPIVIADYVNVS